MPRPHPLSGSDTRLAIVSICAGVGFLVLNDAIAKLLTESYNPVQIIGVRNWIALPIILAILRIRSGRAGWRTRHLGIHALRGALMLVGAFLYFSALRVMALAEATALIFAAPLFITLLSFPLLRERVDGWRWTAVLLGFSGVLLVVQPGSAAFQPASLLVLATASLYALFMILARYIQRDEGLWSMMLFVVLFPALYALPFLFAVWTPVRLMDLPLFLAIAALGSLGITLIGHAFRLAPAALVAPFDYTALIWASGLGWLVWGEIPGTWTLIGATVIIASGLLIIIREAQQKPDGTKAGLIVDNQTTDQQDHGA